MTPPAILTPLVRAELRAAIRNLDNTKARRASNDAVEAAARHIGANPALGPHRLQLASTRYRFWSIPRYRTLLAYTDATDPPPHRADRLHLPGPAAGARRFTGVNRVPRSEQAIDGGIPLGLRYLRECGIFPPPLPSLLLPAIADPLRLLGLAYQAGSNHGNWRLALSQASEWGFTRQIDYTPSPRLRPKFHSTVPPGAIIPPTCLPNSFSRAGRHGTSWKPSPSSIIAKRPEASVTRCR